MDRIDSVWTEEENREWSKAELRRRRRSCDRLRGMLEFREQPGRKRRRPECGWFGGRGHRCKVGVSWNNYSQERWKKADEPAMQKAIAAAGGSTSVPTRTTRPSSS